IIGSIAKQCYECTACPEPFKENKEGVNKVTVGDNDYCQKTSALGIENRGSGGLDCTPTDKMKYCCKGDLCNGATTKTVKKLLHLLGTRSVSDPKHCTIVDELMTNLTTHVAG
ncbi:unnamed protein product, partial [Rotaria sp. Silwood2]